jgi:hypothetical protein
MRTGVRVSGLVLSHAAVALLAVLAAVCAPAQLPPSSGKPAGESAPPVFPKRFYRGPDRQLYLPAGVPVNLGITLSTSAGGQDNAQATTEESNQSSVILKEGPTSLQFGDARVPVIADGTPPNTVLVVDDATHVQHGGLRTLGPAPKLLLSASDALSGVARTLISLDGAPFVPLPDGGPAVTAEGEHGLRYYSVDHVGNAEKLQEFRFRVDSTPPQTRLKISGPRADAVIGAGASLSLSAQDADAGVEQIRYSFDKAAEQAYEKPLQLDELPEGSHHLQFYAEDRVGNRETPQSFTFQLDRQPPEITLSIHGPQFSDKDVRYVSPKAEIELASRDAVAGPSPIRYKIDGAQQSAVYTAPFHLSASAGIHSLRIESEDPVTNRAQVTIDNIYVDPTPPETEVQFSRPFFVRNGDVILNPQSKIALNASDLESGVESVTYSLDGGPEQKYSEPFSVTAEGEHRLTVTAIDQVGNQEPTQQLRLRVQQPGTGQQIPHVLDAKRFYQHPALGLLAPPGLPFIVRIAASPDEGAESYMLSFGPAPVAPAEPLTFTAPGHTTLSVAISKKAEGFAIAIDATPPKTQLTANGASRAEGSGVTYFGPGLRISLASEDDPTGVVSGMWKTLYSLDGTAFATYAAPLDSFSREGAYTLRYYALDNVGNAENQHTFEFTVDTVPPRTLMELRGPHFASTVAPPTRVALAATDNLSGVAQIQYQIDYGKLLKYGEPFAIGAIGDGPHRLRYFAVDAVGNREEEHIWPFILESKVSAASFEVKGKSVERGDTVFLARGSLILLKAAEGETVVYSLDSAAPRPYTAPIPAPESGSHRLSFHAVDELGNAGASRTVNLAADRSAPNSYLHFEGPQLMRESSILISGATRIVLQANAGAVGGATLEYSLGGGRWQTYTAPFNIKYSGAFELSYRARNPLATLEAAQKQHIAVDSQGPVISVSYSKPVNTNAGTLQIDSGTLMFISAEDEPAGLEKITYKLDDQPALIYRTPLSDFAPGKTHTITITAEDLLENRSVKVIHLVVKGHAQ